MDKKPLDFNYLFYLIFLIFGFFFATLSVISIPSIKNYPKAFFLFYSYSQIVLEIFGICGIGIIIKKHLKKKFYYLFVSFAFLFFIRHLIDYVVFKIMDITIWEGLGIALDENIENFIEMLHVTGIPFSIWAIIFISFIFIPFLGILFYKITNKISQIKKINFRLDHLIQTFLYLPLALFIWDFTASESINPSTYSEYQRSLPWKVTFLQPSTLKIEKPVSLKKPENEKIINLIDKMDLKTTNKPNIFIFIVESLRDDCITENISPNLFKFKNENINFENSIANANATQISWFSLFYSHYPMNWAYFKNLKQKNGSYSINILKKMGYNINVFTAPEMKYYNMGEILFGSNTALVDNFQAFPHYLPMEAYESDKLLTDALISSIKKDNNVYLAFFDSTHFLYSWPKDLTKFTPVAEADSLNTYAYKDNIDPIKNRYKNAVYFVDQMISKIISSLKEKNLYDDSIIVILGDHGEEFFEQGRLFHASHLSLEQIKIPIFIKLGKEKINKNPLKKTFCQMDIFPTIFEWIFKENKFKDVLLGESIFEKEPTSSVFTSRYNASRSPYEFFIHTGDEKVTFRFKNKKNVYKRQHLEVVSIKDNQDKEKDINFEEIKGKYLKALKNAFK